MDTTATQVNPTVVRSARAFIRSLCEEYGHEQGLTVWDRVREVLGNQAAGDIFLGMLVSADAQITVESIGLYKIEAIKCVRKLTGWGLKESKDFVESVAYGPKTIDATEYPTNLVDEFCQEMKSIGARVR